MLYSQDVHMPPPEPLVAADSAQKTPAGARTPMWDRKHDNEHQWVKAVSLRRQSIASAAQATVIIAEDDLTGTPAPDLVQRLRYEAGVDVYQSRHGQFDVGIRGLAGLNSPRTITQIDGRDFGLFDIAGIATWVGVLHPTDIIRAEIIKGPGSVTYGANAFGGVIAIKDREVGDFYELHTFAQLGSDGLYEVDATALGPLRLGNPLTNKLYFKFSAGSTQRDDSPAIQGNAPGDDFAQTVQNDSTDIRTQRFSALVGAYLPHNHTLEVEYYDVRILDADWIDDYATGSNYVSIEQQTVGLRLQAPWGEVRYLHYDNHTYYSNSKTVFDATVDYRYTQAHVNSASDIVRAHANHKFNQHYLTVGAEFKRWDSDSNFWSKDAVVTDPSTYRNVTTYNRGVFLEDQWEPSARWTLNTAIRFDNHSIVGDNSSPRIGANYSMNDSQFIRATFSSGYRLPVPIEGSLDQYFYRIDDDLGVEKINSLSIGWQKYWGEDIKRHFISCDIFYSRATDPSFFIPLPISEMSSNFTDWLLGNIAQPGPFFEYQNIDNPYTIIGAELSAAYYASTIHTKLWFNTTLQDFHYDHEIRFFSPGFANPIPGQSGSLFKFDQTLSDDINGPPRVKASLGATWEHQGWHSSCALRYVGSRTAFSFGSSKWAAADHTAVADIDAYSALDLALAYNWGHHDDQQRTLKLSIMDVFNSNHVEAYEPSAAQLQEDNESQQTAKVGRSLVMTFTWKL